jgi:hypothetical protein
MRSALAGFAAILWMACNVVGAFAEQCSLVDFDKGPPSSVKDVTPPTNESKFEWGSDVDRWGTEARAWHYITNLHSKRLSLDWTKPAFVIPFSSPLEGADTLCQYDYANSVKNFKLDPNAPINVSNDGVKAAQAYVKVAETQEPAKSSVTGGELRRTYKSATGEIIAAFARILFRYNAADRLLQVELTSGPGDTQVGLGPQTLGISEETFYAKLKSSELRFKGPFPLEKIVLRRESAAIGANPAQDVIFIRANGEHSLRFENISAAPTGVTPMLLVDPNGQPLGLTSIKLDLLTSAK